MKLNFSAWVRLLEGDLQWLREQVPTLERDHLILIVEGLMDEKKPGAREYYDALPAPRPSP